MDLKKQPFVPSGPRIENKRTPGINERGYTIVQLLVTIAIISVVTTFALMGVTTARANIRLSNSARELAIYVERARADAVRRHGVAIVQILDSTTYSVTMDFADSGTVSTQTFSLETGVSFITAPQTITFDWRGRTPLETSIGFSNGTTTTNVDISGSGDVTIDAQIFHDASIPNVALSGPIAGDILPDPNSTPNASPSPSASPTPSATPSPSPSATPTASPTPSPAPTQPPCTLSASPSSLTIGNNGSGGISVGLNSFNGSGTITATSSNSGQIQVAPASQIVSGGGSAIFTVTVKKQSGSVTLSSTCGAQTVSIQVQ